MAADSLGLVIGLGSSRADRPPPSSSLRQGGGEAGRPEATIRGMTECQANAVLTAREEFPGGHAVLRIAPRGWTLPDFEPGQFCQLGIPGVLDDKGRPVKRAYSLASAPGLDHVELYVKLVDDGTFTRRLWEVSVGDELWLDEAIRGHFTLEPVPADKDVVLVGTGTGLAPYISMIRHYAGRDRWHRLVLVHGTRLVQELGYRPWLEDLAAQDARFSYIPTVTREPADSDWGGLRGRVQGVFEGDAYERLVRAPLDPARCHVFLCGNPAMIDGMEVVLQKLGFRQHTRKEPGSLHFERWW